MNLATYDTGKGTAFMASYPELNGKVALVTGGAAGIGGAASTALAAQGARVAIVDKDAEAASGLVARISAAGGHALAAPADVTRRAEVESAVSEAVAAFERIDILVVAAGGFWHRRTLLEIDEEEWDAITDLNLKSVYLTCHAAVPHMLGHGWGRIVIVSSWLARGAPVNAALHYVSSKAGLIGFTRQLARELAPEKITVNATTPGVAWSPRVRALYDDATIARLEHEILLGRISNAEEHADGIVFLASDAASFMTGAVLDANGGGAMA